MRTIAHISDLHFGKIDRQIADALIADLSEQKPSLIVVSGDLTQRARQWQYKAAADYLAHLPQPRLIVPGNHDIPLYDVVRRFFFPLQFYRRFITNDLWPVYEDEELFAIGLNTARSFSLRLGGFWKDGRIDPDQLIELRGRMRDLSPALFKVVVTHHPFIPPSSDHAADVVHGAGAALAEMEHCGIDLLLAGHLHMGYSGDVRTHHEAVNRSILSVQAGTATSTRRRGAANAYNLISIQFDEIAVEVRNWDGRKFMTSATTLFRRISGVWRQSV